jgi:ferredoxin
MADAAAPVRVGLAVYDKSLCLPWARATDCIVCVDWCPVQPSALEIEQATVVDGQGKTLRLQRPRVDSSRCVGCGACEYACPLPKQAGVRVTGIEVNPPGRISEQIRKTL